MTDKISNSDLYNLDRIFNHEKGTDNDELLEFANKLDNLINQFPKKRKVLCKNVGQKLFHKVQENIMEFTTYEDDDGGLENKGSGTLMDGVDMVVGEGGGYAAVKANYKIAPHTHLVENGHRIVTGKSRDSKIYDALKKARVKPERTKGMSQDEYKKVLTKLENADKKKADTRVYTDKWVAGKHMYRNALNSLVTEIEDDAEKMLSDLVGDIFG